MTLSGYLFAKLLDGKRINYVLFIGTVYYIAPLLDPGNYCSWIQEYSQAKTYMVT
jgi:hypothetical protein